MFFHQTDRTSAQQTIEDFGDQWTRFVDNKGYYGSTDLLRDFVEPLLSLDEFKGQRIADIGSGTGRIVQMLLAAGAEQITAVEPSAAFSVLERNLASYRERVTLLNITGDRLPPLPLVDLITSIGVLHHIPNPEPVVAACFRALRAGGKIIIWVYGREGNQLYLAFFRPLHALTTRLPHGMLSALCTFLNIGLDLYLMLTRWFPLPMRAYLIRVIRKLPREKRRLVIYDQLNPTYAHYYSREQVHQLLSSAGFKKIRTHHRHGYSWTATGEKP